MSKSILCFLYAVLCLCLLLPHNDFRWTYSVPVIGAVPAGPLADGQLIEQDFIAPVDTVSTCLGVYFATYARKNSNQISVVLQSGLNKASWALASRDLTDNAYRYFCPEWKMNGGEQIRFSLLGKGGNGADSPTVWLTSDRSGGEASLNGSATGRGVGYVLANRVRITASSLLHVAHGAFLIGLGATLLMGLAGIAAALPGARRRS